MREPWEYEQVRASRARCSIPLGELPARLGELPGDRELVLVCHHGSRSEQAAQWLARNGFARVHNLAGGVDAWARTVDPAMPRY